MLKEGWTLNKEVVEIALAIIRHPTENSYLIAQRKENVHLADFWEFPGGKRLRGEVIGGVCHPGGAGGSRADSDGVGGLAADYI